MRAAWFRRPLFTFGGVGLVLCLAMFLKSGYERAAVGNGLPHDPRLVRSLSDLEANISGICEFSL